MVSWLETLFAAPCAKTTLSTAMPWACCDDSQDSASKRSCVDAIGKVCRQESKTASKLVGDIGPAMRKKLVRLAEMTSGSRISAASEGSALKVFGMVLAKRRRVKVLYTKERRHGARYN